MAQLIFGIVWSCLKSQAVQEKERKAEFSWFEWEGKLTMKLGVYTYTRKKLSGLWRLIFILNNLCGDAHENLERDKVEDVFSRLWISAFCHWSMLHSLVLSCSAVNSVKTFIFAGNLMWWENLESSFQLVLWTKHIFLSYCNTAKCCLKQLTA